MSTQIECVPHVEVVSPAVRFKVIELCRRARFVRTRARPFAAREGVLHVHSQSAGKASLQRNLKSVVTVVAPAGFIVDLRVRILNRGTTEDAELSNGRNAHNLPARIGPVDDTKSGWNVRTV